jgi:poly(A) polymerase
MGGCAIQTFELLRHYRLFGFLFPATEHCLNRQQQHYPNTLLMRALASADQRCAEGKPVNPAFLFAALLWEPVREQIQHFHDQGLDEVDALHTAADVVFQAQIRRVSLHRRYSLSMREIWEMQQRLTITTGKRPLRLLTHPRFRVGYDFLLLRAETDEPAAELAEWWTRFMAMDEKGRLQAVLPPPKGKKGKSRRRRKPRSAGQPDSTSQPSAEN